MEQTEQAATSDWLTTSAAPLIPDAAAAEQPPSQQFGPQQPGFGGPGFLGLGPIASPPSVRRSPLGWIALVLAIVAAPIGLVVAIIAAVLSRRSLGYVVGSASAAIVVSIVLCVVGAGGGVAYAYFAAGRAHEATLRSSSAAMCTLIATKPGVLSDADYGWPALDSTIPAYVDAVTAYDGWWAAVAKAAPAQITGQVNKIATVVHDNTGRMAQSKVVDQARDSSDLRTVAATSTLPAWTKSYCP
jgi:hypothetical protein